MNEERGTPIPDVLKDPTAEGGMAQVEASYFQRFPGWPPTIQRFDAGISSQWLLESLNQRHTAMSHGPKQIHSVWKQFSQLPIDYRYVINEYINGKGTYGQGHPVNWSLLHLECIFEKRRHNMLNGGTRKGIRGVYLVLKQEKKAGDRSADPDDWEMRKNSESLPRIDSHDSTSRKSTKDRYSPRYSRSSERNTSRHRSRIYSPHSAPREPVVERQYSERKEQESWPRYLPRSVSFKEPEALPARHMHPHYMPAPRRVSEPAPRSAPYPDNYPGPYSSRSRTDCPSFAPSYPGSPGPQGYTDSGPRLKPDFPPYLERPAADWRTSRRRHRASPPHRLSDILEPSNDSTIELSGGTDSTESSEEDVLPSNPAYELRETDKELLDKMLSEYVNPVGECLDTKIDSEKGEQDPAGDKTAGETRVAVDGASNPEPINEFDWASRERKRRRVRKARRRIKHWNHRS